MSLLNARDHSGAEIHAADAIPGCPYICPYCGARVFVKYSKNGKAFYACYANERHKSEYCEYISKTNDTHTIKGFDPELFFKSIFKEKGEGPTPPGPGGGPPPIICPPPFPPAGGGTTTIETPGGNGLDDGPDDNPDDDNHEGEPGEPQNPDDPNNPEDEPEGPQNPEGPEDDPDEKPFASLAQIQREGLCEILKPESPIGILKACEFIIPPKWYKHCFEDNIFTGGNRIIQAHPERPFRDNTIIFSCPWRGGDGIWHKVNFLVQFEERYFFKYLNKLFIKEINEIGLTKRKRRHDWVLIAGCWKDTGNAEYRDYKCKCDNKRQIYICPNKND